MFRTALVCVVFAAACSKKDNKGQSQPAQAQPAGSGATAAAPATPPKPKKPPPPEDMNRTCHITGSGAVAFDQTTHPGGPMAMAVMNWLDPAMRDKLGYGKEGFIINCSGEKMDLNILTATNKEFPMKPAKYVIGGGYSPVRVLGTIKDGTEYNIAKGDGELEITAFDDKHIAGKGTFTPTTFPARAGITIAFDFDMVKE
jgi:hypothetical protein